MRFELKNYKDKEGQSVVRLVLGSGDMKKRIHTQLKIEPRYFQNKLNNWIKRTHPNAVYLNNYLASFYLKHKNFDALKDVLTVKAAIEIYLKSRLASDLQPSTLKKINTSLHDWLEFLAKTSTTNLNVMSVDRRLVHDFFNYQINMGNRRSTANHKVKDLMAMFNFLKNELELIPLNPIEGIRFKNVGNEVKKVMTLSQIQKLLEYQPKTKLEKLGKDMWFVSFHAKGLRISDIVLMKKDQVEVSSEGKFVTLNTKKTGAPIRIWLSERLEGYIEEYDNPDSIFLFDLGQRAETVRDVDRINSKIRKGLKEIGSKLGIAELKGVHTSRSAFAQMASEGRSTLQEIQQALGHTKITTTQVYLDRLTPNAHEEMVENVMKRVYEG